MPSKQITINRSGNVDLWSVRLDEHSLPFNGDSFRSDIAVGQHVLQWFVRGGPGASYTLEVTAPPEAAFKYTGVLDASEKDAGHVWITVVA